MVAALTAWGVILLLFFGPSLAIATADVLHTRRRVANTFGGAVWAAVAVFMAWTILVVDGEFQDITRAIAIGVAVLSGTFLVLTGLLMHAVVAPTRTAGGARE